MKPLALVIDRDAGTRRLLDILLSRYGFEVDRVGAASEGITLLDAIEYDFVLCDDDSIVKWLFTNRPDTMQRVMVLSSAPEAQLVRMKNDWPGIPVIRKPFELADVIDASRDAVANRRPRVASEYELFYRQSINAGAKSGIVVRRNGDVLELVTKFGYEPGAVEQWFPMALSNPYPICMAVRHGRPLWLASLAGAQSEYPLLASVWQTHQTRALAVAPIFHGGTVVGAAGWTFREPQRFAESEQRAWMAIAEHAASFIEGGQTSQSTTQAGA